MSESSGYNRSYDDSCTMSVDLISCQLLYALQGHVQTSGSNFRGDDSSRDDKLYMCVIVRYYNVQCVNLGRPTNIISCQGRGGGLALIYKSNMKVTAMRPQQKHRSFEALETIKILIPGRHLVVIYRPPLSQRTLLTAGMFFEEESSDLLEGYACVSGDLIMTRDVNFHFE